MEDNDLAKTIGFIEGNYGKTLSSNEIVALKKELKEYDYQRFIDNLSFPLLKKVDYFTVQALHKIILEDKELEELKIRLGIKSFDELYEN